MHYVINISFISPPRMHKIKYVQKTTTNNKETIINSQLKLIVYLTMRYGRKTLTPFLVRCTKCLIKRIPIISRLFMHVCVGNVEACKTVNCVKCPQ